LCGTGKLGIWYGYCRLRAHSLLSRPPQVLDLPPTDGSTPITGDTRVTFLDEYRVMVLTSKRVSDVPEFVLFDTLVPSGHPVTSKRFRTPPRYHGWYSAVFLDDDWSSGILDRDRPFTTDPTQAVFVVKLVNPQRPHVLLVVRIQPLIEYICSASTETCVPWREWGRDVVVMRVPWRYAPYPLVHGTNMIVVKKSTTPGIDRYHYNLSIFDFSRRGWSLLLPCDDDGGVGWRAAFERGRNLLLQGSQEMDKRRFHSLGDGRFMCLVSHPRRQTVWNADTLLRTTPVLGACCAFGSWSERSLPILPRLARARYCTAGREDSTEMLLTLRARIGVFAGLGC